MRAGPAIAFIAASLLGWAGCVAEVNAPSYRPGSLDPTAPITPDGPRAPTDPAACDPGNKALHRLNRNEYDRAVKDLLGVSATDAHTFPADDLARGFDNNADVLASSLLLTEKLADSASALAADLFAPREDDIAIAASMIPCTDGLCAEQTLRPLLRRAFRRPVTDADVDTYVGLVDSAIAAGDTFDEGIQLAIEAMLLSPSFLFRAESDGDESGVHRVSDIELASRLSFMLWGSIPDERLLDLAERNELSRRDVLASEVNRMLNDERSDRGLAHAIASQWLDTRALEHASPDATLYPLSASLKEAMVMETQLVVQEIMRRNRKATDVLDADFTYVNAALAAHYDIDIDGIEDDDGDGFVRVSLQGTTRRGVLSHGSILAAHSYPFRTSPVKRGRFVVDALLCIPPGDAPPDIPAFPEGGGGSVRERMEQHRSDPSCAACHGMMDPIGFGLESFDPAGKARTHDKDGFVIDDSDVFFDVTFQGPAGLASVLKAQEAVDYCLAERMGSYALGRGLDMGVRADGCTVADIAGRAIDKGFSWRDIVQTIVEADAFQMRRPRTEADDARLQPTAGEE